jgi:predicted enzyme related to lactoylglutathione lyase
MPKHNFVHIEISTRDRVAAAEFYNQLFDWKVTQVPEMDYATFETGEGPGGGFSPVNNENPAGTVLVHIQSDDIDADLARVERLGGKIVRPKSEIPGVGWWGVFKDPTGNMLALFTPLPGM